MIIKSLVEPFLFLPSSFNSADSLPPNTRTRPSLYPIKIIIHHLPSISICLPTVHEMGSSELMPGSKPCYPPQRPGHVYGWVGKEREEKRMRAAEDKEEKEAKKKNQPTTFSRRWTAAEAAAERADAAKRVLRASEEEWAKHLLRKVESRKTDVVGKLQATGGRESVAHRSCGGWSGALHRQRQRELIQSCKRKKGCMTDLILIEIDSRV